MGRATQFERGLDALWQRRSAALRALVIPQRGQPKAFTRKHRERELASLLDLASTLQPARLARRQMRKLEVLSVGLKRRGTRRDADARFDKLKAWAQRHLRGHSFVYVFLDGARCTYVGQARSVGRLKRYRRDVVFRRARKVRFYLTTKGRLDLVECLAMHLHEPSENRVSAKRRGRRRCPVCTAQRRIRREIRTIFAR